MFQWFKKLFRSVPQDGRPEGYGTDSEFTAEVVRIVSVEVHPGADRLELVHFAMATGPSSYQVVAGKGDFKVGDLAGYFSVDCILPTGRPEFAFLAKDGKSSHRLRAARLRGVFSQGLLVKLNAADPTGKLRYLGDYLGTEFGVTYHCVEAVGEVGPTKPTAKPKKQPFPVYAVDSLKKLPNLFAPDESVFVTEKIHGTNFRFGWVRRRILGVPVGWKFMVGSHRVMKGLIGGKHHYGEDLWSNAAGAMNLSAKTAKNKGDIFFGELYGHTYSGAKIQDLVYGTKPESGPQLAVFDVKTTKGWLQPDERLALLEQLDLPGVPVLGEYRLGETSAETLAEGKSLVDGASSQLREGCVVESMGAPRRKAKYVSQGYLMRKDA